MHKISLLMIVMLLSNYASAHAGHAWVGVHPMIHAEAWPIAALLLLALCLWVGLKARIQ